MQLSMEEARRAEEESTKQAAAASATESDTAPTAANPTLEIDAEDAELQAALQFSLGLVSAHP